MPSSKNADALSNAAIYFGSETSKFRQAISSGNLPEQGHEHLEKHVNKLLELTKLAVKELLTPKGGGKVASGAAYAALYKLAHAVTELCEETRIVPAPLPGKPHQM